MSIAEKLKAAIQAAFRAFWFRQTSTIEDRLEDRLGKIGIPYERDPMEHTEQDSAPTPATVDQNTQGSGDQHFLWKPEKEGGGPAVCLFPAKYQQRNVGDNWLITGCHLEGSAHDGDDLTDLYSPGVNGNRVHGRWPRRGAEYGKGFKVVLELKSGPPATWTIRDGEDRQTV